MIRSYIILLLITCFTISCSKKEENNTKLSITQYQKDSLSFDLPVGWKVKQDYTNKTGRYLELDKYSDYKVKSTLAIGILHDNVISDSVIASQIRQLQFYYQKVNFKLLEQNKKIQLGKYPAIMTSYEADDTKNKVYGKICVIQNNNKTISVQIVDSETKEGLSEYNTIFNTFTIR